MNRNPQAPDSATAIRLVLVDDHELFRAGVRGELDGVATGIERDSADESSDLEVPAIEIVGEAADVAGAVDVIRATEPDVVLLDVHLPGGGGHEVIARIGDDVDGGPEPKFLALSVSDAAEDVIAVVRAGARGYVTKTITVTELADGIRRVHEGDAVFSPRLAGFVLDAFAGDLPAPADPDLDLLTAREQEVLRLIARGYTYKEVAGRLHLSIKTIESHVSSVLRKLQLSNRHQLTAWANERRIV